LVLLVGLLRGNFVGALRRVRSSGSRYLRGKEQK